MIKNKVVDKYTLVERLNATGKQKVNFYSFFYYKYIMKKATAHSKVAIVIYYMDGEIANILIGKESKYLSDIDSSIVPAQEFTADTAEKAKHFFSKKALKLSKENGYEVRYDQLKPEGSNKYTVNYRFIDNDNFMYGIIKGGIESGETPIVAAKREASEELGLIIPDKKFKQINENTFCVEISKSDALNTFRDRIEKRTIQHCGEVFDLKFTPLSHVMSLPNLNSVSRRAIDAFIGTELVAKASTSVEKETVTKVKVEKTPLSKESVIKVETIRKLDWQPAFSNTHKRCYWYNTITDKSVWVTPTEIDENIVVKHIKGTDQCHFVNNKTGESLGASLDTTHLNASVGGKRKISRKYRKSRYKSSKSSKSRKHRRRKTNKRK